MHMCVFNKWWWWWSVVLFVWQPHSSLFLYIIIHCFFLTVVIYFSVLSNSAIHLFSIFKSRKKKIDIYSSYYLLSCCLWFFTCRRLYNRWTEESIVWKASDSNLIRFIYKIVGFYYLLFNTKIVHILCVRPQY